jgi:hypothetical protein
MQRIEFSGQERLLLWGQLTRRALRLNERDLYPDLRFLTSLSISAAVFPPGNVEKDPGKFHLIGDVWNAPLASNQIPAKFISSAQWLFSTSGGTSGRPG